MSTLNFQSENSYISTGRDWLSCNLAVVYKMCTGMDSLTSLSVRAVNGTIPAFHIVCPQTPPLKSGKRVWCSERHFLSHGAESNGIKNVIIAFHVHCTAGILDLVLNDVITYIYAFCNLIRALRSGSCDKKSRSEHQTLFLAHAGRGWA